MLTMSCSENRTNPLLEESKLPYGAVEFDKIRSTDYLPAFEEALSQLKANIDAIAACADAPTFENTIEPLESCDRLLGNVGRVFYNLMETDADDIMHETEEKAIPMENEANSYIFMNEVIFKRIKELHDNIDNIGLTVEQKEVLKKYYRRFVTGGALLDEKAKARFVEIQNRMGELRIKFANNNLDESNAYVLNVTDINRLKGLPKDQLEAAAARAREKDQEGWSFNIQIYFLAKRFKEVVEISKSTETIVQDRGNNNNEFDNKAIIKEFLQLRLELANLLGYETFADFVLEDRMAKTPQAAYDLLMEIWKYALPQAKRERDEMQKIIDAEGGNFRLEAWDWWYYAEKLRKQKYDLDESQLIPYLTLDNVRKGSFMVAETLFGIKFKKVDNLPVYNPSVETWECLDADGSHLAYFYTDCFVRSTKRQGAWMTSFTDEFNYAGQSQRPTIVNVCNFSVPTDTLPSLLSIDDARTVFHEFGHALHGMLTQCHYPTVSGTATPNDFVEMCSQIMEHWAIEPSILKQYAFHYKTGQAIPDELIAKLQNAGHFNTGFETVELVGAALLDMEYHMLKDYTDFDDQKFEDEISAKLGMIPEIEYRYRGTFFSHIFTNDYCAGYYSYLWAEVLDCDAFQCFKEEGLLNPETGMRYRRNILEKGSSDDLMDLYRRFRGKDPNPQAMLHNRGLIN